MTETDFKEIEFIDDKTILVTDTRDDFNQVIVYYDKDPKVNYSAQIIAIQTGLTTTDKDVQTIINMLVL